MSIFKTLGNKLKRVVSLKNLTRAVTGNFSAIGEDVVRVASTLSPAEQRAKDAGKVPTETVFSVSPLSAEVNTVLDQQGAIFSDNVQNQLAASKITQDAVSFFSQTAIKAFWIKNRNMIIGLGVSIFLFFVAWKVFFQKKTVIKGRARR